LGAGFVENREHDFGAPVTGNFRGLSNRPRPSFWSGRTTDYRRSLIVGMLEGLERHAGLRMRGKRCTVFDCFSNLRHDALDPQECGLYEQIPIASNLEPFTEQTKLRWVWAYSLTESRPLLVPAQLAYYGNDNVGEPDFVRETSNGCAAGTCLEEAVFFALLELIERDAFLIHWYARLSPPRIDLATIRNPQIQLLIERFRRHDLDVFLLDTRLDIRVPTVAAVAKRRDGQLGAFSIALGCNFDPHQAMTSALFEVASHQVGFQKRTETSKAKLHAMLKDFRRVRTLTEHAALYGLPEAVTHARFLVENVADRSAEAAYSDWLKSIPNSNDLLDDIQHCVGLLVSAGLKQVIVVDQTTPEERSAGLYTVRAIVPGMMPMDFGHGFCRAIGLSRLYRVPVELGLRASMNPDDINRVPHPFA
jgi:ribosomal protein S12 methylthiotransferase accessory factor